MTQNQLFIETQRLPMQRFVGASSPTRSVLSCFTTPKGQVVCTQHEVTNYDYYADAQRNRNFQLSLIAAKAGTALEQITKIYDAHPELPASDHAGALVHYGDWNLVMRRKSSAIKAYKQAILVLQASPEDRDQIEALFGNPTQIPTLMLPLPEVDQHEAEKEQEYVKLKLDVTDNGSPRNVEVVESSDPNDVTARRDAKRDMRKRIFRPRFVNGEPAATEGLSFKWVVK